MPLTVTSALLLPAVRAARLLALAIPRSSWPWKPRPSRGAVREGTDRGLGLKGVPDAHRVRQPEAIDPGVPRQPGGAEQKCRLGPRGVLPERD